MDQDFKKIETMDDLRALMNDPEVKAANKEFSKKYLKANRPKSIAVVIISLAAFCGVLSLSQIKIASVTPPQLRTAEEISIVWQDEGASTDPVILTDGQHEALIDLFEEMPVTRKMDESVAEDFALPAAELTAAEATVRISREGIMLIEDSIYTIDDPETLWTEMEAILAD